MRPDDIHLVCPGCGDSVVIYNEVAEQTYGAGPQVRKTEYSSANHLREWIDRVRGVEDTEIPIALVTKVKEARCESLADVMSFLRCVRTVRYNDKDIRCSLYYRNAVKILRMATGVRPPSMSNDVISDIEAVFAMLEVPYRTYQSGKNLPSYQYILFKICQLLGYDEFLPWFVLFRTRDTVRLHDSTWEKVCKHNNWDFYETPTKKR